MHNDSYIVFQVYIINLKKRVGRRAFMQQTMYDLGVKNYKFFEAVDGKYVKVYNIVYNPVLQ